MDYDHIIDLLLKEFPELASQYESEKDYMEGLPYLVFEEIFVPYLIKQVDENINKSKPLQLFNFIEQMILSPDKQTHDLAIVAIIESLLPEREFLEKAKTLWGTHSRHKLEVLEETYGWKN